MENYQEAVRVLDLTLALTLALHLPRMLVRLGMFCSLPHIVHFWKCGLHEVVMRIK